MIQFFMSIFTYILNAKKFLNLCLISTFNIIFIIITTRMLAYGVDENGTSQGRFFLSL